MTGTYEQIDEKLTRWLMAQPVFFVGTAPSGSDGHLNVSPKGQAGTFAVFGPRQVGYLEYFGSGIETVAHLRDNGRIIIMCCAFDGPPKIVRLHGRGRIVLPEHAEFAELRGHFAKDRDHAVRSIIVVDVIRIADSCGYGVPRMELVQDRDVLDLYQLKKTPEYFENYAVTTNAKSIDGLPGMPSAG